MPLANGTKPEFVVIAGPTASGKSSFALSLAAQLGGEIICCDSVQIYKGFDLGSAKPTIAEQRTVPHHLFDVFMWNELCDAAVYAKRAREAISDIRNRGALPIVVGGTGLYLRALLGQRWDDEVPSDPELRRRLSARESEDLFAELTSLDPVRASQIHRNDRFRVIRALEINTMTGFPVQQTLKQADTGSCHCLVSLQVPRDILYERIKLRTRAMIASGLLNEVRNLLSQGVLPTCKPMGSIGYREAIQVIQGLLAETEFEEKVATATRQYAKRQITWFKKVHADVVIVNYDHPAEFISQVKDLL